ncbi:MAG: transcriptional regulator NrdR [Chloroflexota bacterium]
MKCPNCGTVGDTYVLETSQMGTGEIRRRRECRTCGTRFNTFERSVMQLPQIVKSGGYREPYDREKVMQGLRLACVKRPVSTESLEQLVNRIEEDLRQMGQPEVSSEVIGNKIIMGLRALDMIAYIRFALVYLQIDDLASIQALIEESRQQV